MRCVVSIINAPPSQGCVAEGTHAPKMNCANRLAHSLTHSLIHHNTPQTTSSTSSQVSSDTKKKNTMRKTKKQKLKPKDIEYKQKQNVMAKETQSLDVDTPVSILSHVLALFVPDARILFHKFPPSHLPSSPPNPLPSQLLYLASGTKATNRECSCRHVRCFASVINVPPSQGRVAEGAHSLQNELC